MLARGIVDLSVAAPLPDSEDDFPRGPLLSDRLVLVGRRDGVLAVTPPGRTPKFINVLVPHVSASRHGEFYGPFDDALAELGLSRDDRELAAEAAAPA